MLSDTVSIGARRNHSQRLHRRVHRVRGPALHGGQSRRVAFPLPRDQHLLSGLALTFLVAHESLNVPSEVSRLCMLEPGKLQVVSVSPLELAILVALCLGGRYRGRHSSTYEGSRCRCSRPAS